MKQGVHQPDLDVSDAGWTARDGQDVKQVCHTHTQRGMYVASQHWPRIAAVMIGWSSEVLLRVADSVGRVVGIGRTLHLRPP